MFTPSPITEGYFVIGDEGLPLVTANILMAEPRKAVALISILLSGAEYHPSVAYKTAQALAVLLDEGVEGFSSYVDAEMVAMTAALAEEV